MKELFIEKNEDAEMYIKDSAWMYPHLMPEVEMFLSSDEESRIALVIGFNDSDESIAITLEAAAILIVVEKYKEWLLETEQYELINHADELIESAKNKML